MRSRLAFVVLAVILIAASLRAPITAVGPLVEEIERDAGLSLSAIGMLTTLPLIGFAAAASVSAAAARRFGIGAAMLASMIAVAGGILARLDPSVIPLFAGTAVLGLGIGVANTLLPALVKQEFPERLGLLTSVYAVVLAGGAGLGAGLAIPLSQGLGLGWERAIAVWALPALAAAALLIGLRRSRSARPEAAASIPRADQRIMRSPIAWQVTAYWGAQSVIFYLVIAWLPAALVASGMEAGRAGAMIFVYQAAAVVALIAVPKISEAMADQRSLGLAAGAITAAGLAGLIAFDVATAPVWVVVLGIGGGCSLGLGLMFFVLRARTSERSAELSGMAQTFGYLLAALGPVSAGALASATGDWTPVLLLLLALAALQAVVGRLAGRSVYA